MRRRGKKNELKYRIFSVQSTVHSLYDTFSKSLTSMGIHRTRTNREAAFRVFPKKGRVRSLSLSLSLFLIVNALSLPLFSLSRSSCLPSLLLLILRFTETSSFSLHFHSSRRSLHQPIDVQSFPSSLEVTIRREEDITPGVEIHPLHHTYHITSLQKLIIFNPNFNHHQFQSSESIYG